jgi:endoribonuclease LACTB2
LCHIGTNTYLVGKGPKRLLIDTGEGKPEWLNLVKSVLEKENATLSTVLVTHWHPDHIGGVRDLQTLDPPPKIYKSQIVPHEDMEDINDGQTWTVDSDTTIRAFHCPGHTEDHMALILEEESAMFTGDNVLGHGTAVFEDLATYMSSLHRMSSQVSGRAYPGHGAEILDCSAKIQEYIAHRAMREREVLEVLSRSGTGGEGWAPMDMVKIIYEDVPESLHFAAARGVMQILEKLAGEGKVCFNNEKGDTWSLNRKAVL